MITYFDSQGGITTKDKAVVWEDEEGNRSLVKSYSAEMLTGLNPIICKNFVSIQFSDGTKAKVAAKIREKLKNPGKSNKP